MTTDSIIQPKQKRSLDTQRKLLSALHFCLQDKFFEHISIKELADHAGVSVGTFYRRFKDKESLLPLLYQDFGNDLDQWVSHLENASFANLQQAIETISKKMYQFILAKKSVFRTLHLNARLHSDLLDSDKNVDRKQVYQRLTGLFLQFEDEISCANKTTAAGVVVYMMINSLLDKVLYPEATPAISCELDAAAFANELPEVLRAYLTR